MPKTVSTEENRITCPSCGAVIDSEGKAVYTKAPKAIELEDSLLRVNSLIEETKKSREQMEKVIERIQEYAKEKKVNVAEIAPLDDIFG